MSLKFIHKIFFDLILIFLGKFFILEISGQKLFLNITEKSRYFGNNIGILIWKFQDNSTRYVNYDKKIMIEQSNKLCSKLNYDSIHSVYYATQLENHL